MNSTHTPVKIDGVWYLYLPQCFEEAAQTDPTKAEHTGGVPQETVHGKSNLSFALGAGPIKQGAVGKRKKQPTQAKHLNVLYGLGNHKSTLVKKLPGTL